MSTARAFQSIPHDSHDPIGSIGSLFLVPDIEPLFERFFPVACVCHMWDLVCTLLDFWSIIKVASNQLRDVSRLTVIKVWKRWPSIGPCRCGSLCQYCDRAFACDSQYCVIHSGYLCWLHCWQGDLLCIWQWRWHAYFWSFVGTIRVCKKLHTIMQEI